MRGHGGRWATLLILGVLMGPWVTASVAAQGSGAIGRVTTISSDTEQGSSPTLAVDPSGAVHAFWSSRRADRESESLVILYAQYRDGTWADPVDILTSPNGGPALYPRAVVDRAGRLHLIWSGTEGGPFGPLYHSWAPVGEALSVQSWQAPVLIAEGTLQSDVRVDSEGRLHLVYASVRDGRGICTMVSADAGDHWVEQSCIPRTYVLRDGEAEVRPRLALDSQDTLHVVWTLDDYSPLAQTDYYATAVFYANSSDRGMSWSDTLTIDRVDRRDPSYSGRPPAWGNVAVDAQDRVHIVWVGAPDMLRRHEWSSDGGRTWTSPQIAIQSGGYNNWQGLAVDSAGTLHLAWPSLRGLEYTWWDGSQWASPVLIDDRAGPHHGQAAIALGNQLHIVWQNHGGSLEVGEPGLILHALIETDAPRLAPQPVAALEGPATAIPATAAEADAAATASADAPYATATRALLPELPTTTSEAPPPLLVALVPALALVAIVLVVRIRARR